MAASEIWEKLGKKARAFLRAVGLGVSDSHEASAKLKKHSIKKSIELALQSEQRMAMPQLDRWSRMLKALQVAPHALMPALDRELDRGLSPEEMLIKPTKEGMFFDGLMVGKKLDALDFFCSMLDQEAVRARVMGKIPSLRAWALGNLGDGALLRDRNKDTLAWARATGRLRPELKEALLAEAIENGRPEIARRELQDAGLEKLDAGDMDKYMDAFAQRKEAGLSSGLDAQGLEAFAQSMGGWGELAEAAAGLGFDKLMDLVEHMMKALAEESLMEEKVFARAKATSTKRAREMIALAVAAQAAKNDRPESLRAAIDARADAMGTSREKAAMSMVKRARVRVGTMDVEMGLAGGVGLFEIAKLSGSKGAQEMMASISNQSAQMSADRLGALVKDAEKGVRGLVMRSSGEARAATKAWRETVKEWKQGVHGDASLADLQERVRSQIKGSPVAEAPRRPKGP